MSTLGAELERAIAYLEILRSAWANARHAGRRARSAARHAVARDDAADAGRERDQARLEPRTGGGTVWIRARQDDGNVLVTVADNGEGFNAKTSGTGIGLKNVRERLRLRYAGDANLSVVANFPAGVAATITVPAHPARRGGAHV